MKPAPHASRTGAAALILLLLLVSAFWGCSDKKDVVRIATKPMTEQLILGEMLSLLIQDRTGLNVKLTKGVGGGTANIHPGLVAGEFDMYPEYTGTAWLYVLKKTGIPPQDEMRAELTREYESRYGLLWVGLYGFNNTFAIAVRDGLADQLGLRTFSDLAKASPDLVFGANYDFYEREDGYPALRETYGMRFKKTLDLDIGLRYQAIGSGQVDSVVIFTTDGMRSMSGIRVLEDDKGLFPEYLGGTVVRAETLRRHPELKPVLLLMDNLITDQEMAALNYEVENKKRGERDVAREFLEKKGLLERRP